MNTASDSLQFVSGTARAAPFDITPSMTVYAIEGFFCFLLLFLFIYFIDIKQAPEEKKKGHYVKALLVLGFAGFLGVSAFSSMLDWEYRLGIPFSGPLLGLFWMCGLIAAGKSLGIAIRVVSVERQFAPASFGRAVLILSLATVLIFGILVPYVDVRMTMRDYGRAITVSLVEKTGKLTEDFLTIHKQLDGITENLKNTGRIRGANIYRFEAREIKENEERKAENLRNASESIMRFERLFQYGESMVDYIVLEMAKNGNVERNPTSGEVQSAFKAWQFDSYLIAFGLSFGCIFGFAFLTFLFPSIEIRRIGINMLEDSAEGHSKYAKVVKEKALAQVSMAEAQYIEANAQRIGQRFGKTAIEHMESSGRAEFLDRSTRRKGTLQVPTNGNGNADPEDLPEDIRPKKKRKKATLVKPQQK